MPIKYVSVHGTAVHYWHTGRTTLPDVVPDLSRGAVVVFVHGAGQNGALWQSSLAALAPQHSPLAFDFPGHGRSAGTAALASIDEYRDCLAGFLDALGLRHCVLVGQDLGGATVLAYARQQPARVRGLLLTGTAARFQYPATWLDTWRDVMRGRRPQPFTNDGFSPAVDMAVLRTVLTEQVKTDPRVRYHDLVVCNTFEATAWLEELRVPTLVVSGRDDPWVSASQAQVLHDRIHGSELRLVDAAGHFVPWEQSAVFASALYDFLAGLEAPPV